MRLSRRLRRFGSSHVLVALGVLGCGEEPQPPAAQDLPSVQSYSANSDSFAEQSATVTIDWSNVPTLPSIEGMGEAMRAVRHLTSWYSGSKKVIFLRFQPPASAVDDSGNEIPMSPAQWKALMQRVRSAPEQPMPMLSPSENMLDALGKLARYVYRIQVEQDRIRFTCLGLFEDLYPDQR